LSHLIYTHIYTLAMSDRAFLSENYNGEFWTSTFKHPSSLSGIVSNLNQDEFQLVISLAITALDQMKQSVQTIQYQEALSHEIKRHQDLFENERRTYEDRLSTLSLTTQQERQKLLSHHAQHISELEASLHVSEFSSGKLKEQFDLLSKKSEAILKSSIEQIVEQKEIQHRSEFERLQESHKSLIATLEKQAKERVADSNSHYKDSLEQLRKLYTEREDKLRKELEKTYGSSDKGKQGEKEFDEFAAQFTKWPKLQNTSGTAHATDRRVKIRNCETLFELKNYADDVNSEQVKKFERDMEENSNCPLGVFISMKSNIVGKKSSPFVTAWTPKNQLLVYINTFYSHSIQEVMNMIDLCSDIAWMFYKTARENSDSSETLVFQSRLEQARVIVDKEINAMTEVLRGLKHDKAFMTEQLNRVYTKYLYDAKQRKESLVSLLEILLGETETYEEPTLTPTESNEQKESVKPKPKTKRKSNTKKDTSEV
jgi:hypothetical protein